MGGLIVALLTYWTTSHLQKQKLTTDVLFDYISRRGGFEEAVRELGEFWKTLPTGSGAISLPPPLESKVRLFGDWLEMVGTLYYKRLISKHLIDAVELAKNVKEFDDVLPTEYEKYWKFHRHLVDGEQEEITWLLTKRWLT